MVQPAQSPASPCSLSAPKRRFRKTRETFFSCIDAFYRSCHTGLCLNTNLIPKERAAIHLGDEKATDLIVLFCLLLGASCQHDGDVYCSCQRCCICRTLGYEDREMAYGRLCIRSILRLNYRIPGQQRVLIVPWRSRFQSSH